MLDDHDRFPPGSPLPHAVRTAEENDGGSADGRGQMGRAGVGADQEIRPLNKRGALRYRELAGPVFDTWPGFALKQLCGQYSILAAADQHDARTVFDDEPAEQLSPMLGWPTLGRRASADVEHNQGFSITPVCLLTPIGAWPEWESGRQGEGEK